MVSLLGRKADAPELDPHEMRALRADVDSLRRSQVEAGLAEQRARVDALKRAELARRAADQATRMGPCIYCGLSRSRTGPLGWQGNPGRVACPWCLHDRGFFHSDLEHKSIVLNRIITGDWKSRRYPYGQQAELLIQRTGFRWWHEVPNAQPGEWESWAYLDLAAIRQRATPTTPEPPPRYWKGDPCPRCGCAFMWTNIVGHTWEGMVVPGGDGGVVSFTRSEPSGVGCGGCVEISDLDGGGLDDVMKKVVGIRESGSYETLGVTWFADRPIRSGEHARGLTLAPFKYLDLANLRRRAFQHFPFESQWTMQGVWQQLFAEATGGR